MSDTLRSTGFKHAIPKSKGVKIALLISVRFYC